MDISLELVAALPLVAYVLWRLVCWLLTPVPLAGIPHNGVKVLGDFREFTGVIKTTGTLLTYFDTMRRRHGPICQILMPFGMSRVLVSDVEAIRDILERRTPKEFDRDRVAMVALGAPNPTGMVGQPANAIWRLHRRILAPVVTKPYLGRMTPRMTAGIYELVQLWTLKRKMLKSSPFSVKADIVLSSSDIISSIVFGEPFGEVARSLRHCETLSALPTPNARGGYDDIDTNYSPFYRSFAYVWETMGASMYFVTPALYNAIVFRLPAYKRARNTIWTMFDRKVAEARIAIAAREVQGDDRGDNILAMIIEKEAAGTTISHNEITDELFEMLAAGSETTATTLAWTLKILARHPEFQRQLHAYLTTHLAPLEDRLPSYEDVTAEALPLLEATAHELIRLSRPTDGAAREAMVDTQILGHAIPKGTLMVVTGGTTYDETRSSLNVSSEELRQRRGCDAWTDDRPADELYPERWLDEQGKFDAKAGPFFNFSAGLRGCFGRSIAILELKLYLVILSMSFFFEAVPKDLDSDRVQMRVTMVPVEAYARPVPWTEVE